MRALLRLVVYPPVWFLAQLGLTVLLLRQTESSIPWLTSIRAECGIGLTVLGVALSAWAILTVRYGRTPILPYRQPEQLLTRGPFRFSRNPIYLGEAMILAGIALRSGEALPWLTLPLFLLGLTAGPVRWEEEALRNRFGEAYRSYCQQVRRWL